MEIWEERIVRLEGYSHFGGNHCDTAVIKNALAYAGVTNPHTGAPLTEAEVLGIAGGIGAGFSFCPSVPRYGLGGGVTVVARHLSYSFDGAFHKGFFGRLGIKTNVTEASTPGAALKKLAAELSTGRPVIVWCGKGLAYCGGQDAVIYDAAGGYSIVVHGIDDDRRVAHVADLGATSFTVPLDNLAKARAQICTHKNRTLTLEPPEKLAPSRVENAMIAGLRACVGEMKTPRIKRFSLQGLEEWASLIANLRNAEGWPKFYEGGRMYWPLKNVYATIETEGTGGSLMRPMFADFLEAAARVTKKQALGDCAREYRRLGRQWSQLADAALPGRVEAFRRTKELLEREARLFRTKGEKALPEIEAVRRELRELEAKLLKKFPLDAKQTMALLEDLRGRITTLHAAETTAVDRLARVV